MLLADQQVFKLEKKYQKILYVAPTANQTICFTGIVDREHECLTHVGKDGKILHQILFDDNTDSFAVLTEDQVCTLDTKNNKIVVLNLYDHQQFAIDYQFNTEAVDQMTLDIFPETQSVVVRENGRCNNNTIKLSYFHYPLTPDSKPYHVYENADGVWTYDYTIRRANNHSMYVWFKQRHDDGFEFKTYDIRDNPDGKLETYKFPQEVGKAQGQNKVELAMTSIWEVTPNIFMFVCITSRKENTNNNFICDTKTGEIREVKFNFGKFQSQTIDQMNFGTTSMFKTFEHENGKAKTTPVYFINNETEEIVAEEKWECSHLNKYSFVGYDGNMIVDALFENGNVDEIVMTYKKVMQPKEISVHFLNEIIEDCDDDLLYEVTKVIDYSK